ncbi:hypothetical protein AB0O91_21170 [Kitasatospora sp. NPDC089797]|uniref:hypothetical protein n=1 Tax=Kitasatospora sp. NPDC089797 TaxID=3155298 RepID=UPI00342DD77E
MSRPRPTWTLTRDNLTQLMELIEPSKPHYRSRVPAGPYDVSVEIDGLTILAHRERPRAVAHFGDIITHQHDGTWTVQPAAEETTR